MSGFTISCTVATVQQATTVRYIAYTVQDMQQELWLLKTDDIPISFGNAGGNAGRNRKVRMALDSKVLCIQYYWEGLQAKKVCNEFEKKNLEVRI